MIRFNETNSLCTGHLHSHCSMIKAGATKTHLTNGKCRILNPQGRDEKGTNAFQHGTILLYHISITEVDQLSKDSNSITSKISK